MLYEKKYISPTFISWVRLRSNWKADLDKKLWIIWRLPIIKDQKKTQKWPMFEIIYTEPKCLRITKKFLVIIEQNQIKTICFLEISAPLYFLKKTFILLWPLFYFWSYLKLYFFGQKKKTNSILLLKNWSIFEFS
jgi:hypothetical protein